MSKYERILELPPGLNRQGQGGLRTRGVFKKGTPEQPLISVITVVFNGEDFLEQTILSVLDQSYPHLEFIIVDGGSNDRSLEIIRKYQDRIDYWVSEKDQGISDAFNKGVRLAAGDYINFQGDGDGFVTANTLEALFAEVNIKTDILISAQVKRIDLQDKVLYVSRYHPFRKTSLLFRMSLPHQGLFTHRKMFEDFGLFDVKNKFCMDYDLLLRAYDQFPVVKVSKQAVANWRADGLGMGKTLQILKEYDLIKRKNQVASSPILTLLYYWSVFKFRIKQMLGAA